MLQSRLRLTFLRILEWDEALILLRIRNECREGMTHMTSTLTEKDQYEFYVDHLSTVTGDGKYEAYLLESDHDAIGYGLLKWDDEKEAYWMTAGLVKAWRNKGLSRLLINFITEMGHREGADVWIDVWDDNAALFGDIRVGYEFVLSRLVDGKTLHIMKHHRERLLGYQEKEWMQEHGKNDKTKPNPPESILREIEEVDIISRDFQGKPMTRDDIDREVARFGTETLY
jgi:GNAT superfamily N-acetyltransferase